MIERINLLLKLIKRMLSVMGKREKRRIPIVVVVILIGGMLDVFSISALFPLAQTIMNGEINDSQNSLWSVMHFLGIDSFKEMTFFLALFVVIVFVLKNIYMIFLTNYQARYVSDVRTDISKKMMRGYISCNYSYFVDNNSSEMLRGLTTDVAAFVSTLGNFFDIIVRIINIVLLLLLMAVSSPTLTIGVAVVGVMTILIITIGLKRPMKYFGELNRVANQEVLNSATQTVTGIKEVKILHRDNYFVERYGKAVEKLGRTEASYKTISVCPERVIETCFVIAIGVGMSVLSNDSLYALIPSAVVFGAAIIKLLPYISQLAGCFSNLIYFYPATDSAVCNVEKGLSIVAEVKESIDKGCKEYKDEVRFEEISFSYDNGRKIFDNARFVIKKGDAIGLIGPSGAGKTTLADIILGLRETIEKIVIVDGKEYELGEYTWNGMMGYVSQNLFMLDDTIRHNIAFGQQDDDIDEAKLWDVIRQAQLEEFVKSLPDGLDTSVGEVGAKISGGQKQRIAIARALYYEPEIIVLDEATSALDNDTEAALMDAINALQGSKTLIIIAHRLTTVKNCDHVYRVDDGKIEEVNKDILFG